MNTHRKKPEAFHRLPSVIASVCLTALFIGASGCQWFNPGSKAGLHKETPKDFSTSENQLRLRMRALVQPMCDELEHAADAIIAGTTNRSVQVAALRWKIEGVPAMRTALFQPDPFTAAADTWVLCNQMADYFEKGTGKESLGAATSQAVKACRRMEEEFAEVAASATTSGDVSKLRALARKWAAERPIQYSIAGRESTLSRALEQEVRDEFSMGQAVSDVTMTTDDLSRKLDVYSDQLFRQARWEAELFKLELLKDLPVNQAIPLAEQGIKSAKETVTTIEGLTAAVERAGAVAEKAPQLVASERETAIRAIQLEVGRAVESIHQERLAALKQFHEALREERKAMTKDAEVISVSAVDHAMARLQWLVGLALVIGMVAAFLGLFVVRRMFFRRPSEARLPRP